jgi:hypothetical protein
LAIFAATTERAPSVLNPDLLAKLKIWLKQPPADGGLWTSGKVANWMAQQLGLTALAPQRGWEAAAGDRLVDPVAAPEEPEVGDARIGRGF